MSNHLAKEYDYIYSGESRHYNKSYKVSPYLKVWEKVASYIKNDYTVVDIGCGPGQMMELLLDKNIKFYIGYEFSPVAIEKANNIITNRNDNNALILYQDLYELDNLMDADIYISIEVMEHLIDDIKVISFIPKGKEVVITVPNYLGGSHVRKFDDENQIIERYKNSIDIEEITKIIYGTGIIFVMKGVKK